ncbi:GNAT superfamily N-acetyltransferase [Anoxybacillus voinovskiensis]|uniref:GNAT superfamily N-acetyltransferase n=1 Tax=Anoxybacteroides voinovskiense TaxID=230470 RepID=A0A840E188_9BACL|nr:MULTISPECIES: GNAT family N-acetyltransferase [Anoxybacillus]MBB4075529.1 GNAT superfamily N-acetyltransferase [Anoxybacillus voinovskiensis]MCL6587209.1 GNAT family N-acetyltransferase [Anoxybacillus sp.]GGJ79824.1 N-acetyltransferase GCN5 [Anoxybacillus voinovskiensis]
MFESLENIREVYLSDEHLLKLQEFRCTDEQIVENFLKEDAYNLMKRNLVRTRLFFDDNQNLIGFYSLFNDTVKIQKQKRAMLEIYLPSSVKEIPAIRLHYLGVDERFRGKGFGSYLMTSVLYHCAKVAEITGCSLITVEATENAKSFYEKFGFTYICPINRYYLMALSTKPLMEELN